MYQRLNFAFFPNTLGAVTGQYRIMSQVAYLEVIYRIPSDPSLGDVGKGGNTMNYFPTTSFISFPFLV